jgi:ApaG protein
VKRFSPGHRTASVRNKAAVLDKRGGFVLDFLPRRGQRVRVMSTEDPKSGRARRPAPLAVQPQRTARVGGSVRADYSRTTRDVEVSVRCFFMADQSQPEDNHFVWGYQVKIENHGTEPVQLLRRTWQITDARGRTQHVHGPGVVGQQPLLEPGESFEYTSGTPLDTPSGFMVGAYHMVIPSSGESFDVAIPAFSLDSPHQSGRVH